MHRKRAASSGAFFVASLPGGNRTRAQAGVAISVRAIMGHAVVADEPGEG